MRTEAAEQRCMSLEKSLRQAAQVDYFVPCRYQLTCIFSNMLFNFKSSKLALCSKQQSTVDGIARDLSEN